MGDFLLDFRARRERRREAEALRFFPDMEVDEIARDEFSLFVSRAGQAALWAPYESPDGVLVALAGRVALPEEEWRDAERIGGAGGLACKAICAAYRSGGADALRGFSGAFTIHLYDPRLRLYLLVTDAGGAAPCYAAGGALFGSHPDVLAQAAGVGGSPSWDLTSMAQFLATGVVTFPYSFYREVRALDFGCVHRLALGAESAPRRTAMRYAGGAIERLSEAGEEQLAEEIANAVATASHCRTLPRFGRTAVALSGGLDSRTVLTSAEAHEGLVAFCAFDQQNAEFRYAQAIARELGVTLYPLARSFDHYGDHAEMAVRIAGGMGDFVSNHFLGFREALRGMKVDNLVTGCYFDYLFKSLALDVSEQGLLRREHLREFRFETYLPHFAPGPGFAAPLRERLDALFPPADRAPLTPLKRAALAARRVFPLYHEGDNAQRLVPHRVMNWFTPAADPAVLELSRVTPPELKLNRRVFLKAVRRACGRAVSRIPDSNTGVPLGASALRVGVQRYAIALRRWHERNRASMTTAESWPNWTHYLQASGRIRELWLRPNPAARSLLGELRGEPFREDLASYRAWPTQYFSRLLTLKLWLDQRSGSG
jgi:asparagine synthase (glutamine-hydrolysing)